MVNVKNYFPDIRELVSYEIYEVLGEASRLLIPDSVLDSLNRLRCSVGLPLRVNDWHTGGQFRYSGVRPVGCAEGAKMSRHKLTDKGVYAFDIKCSDMGKLTRIVKAQSKELGIGRIENPAKTKTWLHCEFYDCIGGAGELVVFDP